MVDSACPRVLSQAEGDCPLHRIRCCPVSKAAHQSWAMSVQSLSPIKWMGWGGLGGWSRKLNPSGMSVILRARRPASAPSLAWVRTRCIEVNESSALLATIALCWGLTCLCFRPFLKGICGLLNFFAKKIRFFDWPLLCRGSCSLNEMPL